jgi:L,D-transpeptidase ErfK/SrfK
MTTGPPAGPFLGFIVLAVATGAAALSGADVPVVSVSHAVTGGAQLYVVRRGDSLASLGARYGISPQGLARQNGLKTDAGLRTGALLTLDNLHVVPAQPGAAIVINVPQRMLFFQSDQEPALGYPIAVGLPNWRTPLGDFTIVEKEEQPTWDVPVSIQKEMRQRGQRVIKKMPPCPQNPLGEYWLALSLPAIGIHGTAAPLSIHRAVTHGCIRMHPDDIRALFPRVEVGQTGRIVYEPILLAEIGGRLYLEAHPDVYRSWAGDPRIAVDRAAGDGGWSGCINWGVAQEVLSRRDGVARLVGLCAGGQPR